MGHTDLRALVARRHESNGHDTTQTILEGLLDRLEAVERRTLEQETAIETIGRLVPEQWVEDHPINAAHAAAVARGGE